MATTFDRILVPVDFSAPSRHALTIACDMAKRFESSITLLNVYQIPGFVYPDGFMPAGPDTMLELLAKTEEALDALTHLARRAGANHLAKKSAEGVPFSTIVAEAEAGGYNLIVMGTHGLTGVKHLLLGSVAENVVRRAHCPVLTVRFNPSPSI